MHYDALLNDHGLPHDPLKAIVTPRPIGWISSMGADGHINLAPYSFFNLAGGNPYYVMFSSTGHKDTWKNIEETGEFVCNLATFDLKDAMNATSAAYPRGVNEMEMAGLTPAPSRFVKPPRIAEAHAALECVHHKTEVLPGVDGTPSNNAIIIGRVVGVYVNDAFIQDGLVKTAKMRPLARLGYMDYAVVDEVFEMGRPQR